MRKAAFLRENLRHEMLLVYLVPARIAVGYHFILVAWPKVFSGFPGENLAKQLLANAPRDPVSLHRDFIVGFVVPHVDFFSALIAYGEMAIGISLITGCLVRVASSFGAFHNLNIFLAVAIPSASAQVPWNRTLVLMHLVFVASAAGRCLGVDAFLKKQFPRSSLF